MRVLKTKIPYKIASSDFSGQEPRLTAFYAQDENMIKAYNDDRDLYSVIASMAFDRKYEDCLEFYPEGTHIMYEGKEVVCGHKTHVNKEGKMYRTYAKSVLLGVLYGRGAKSVGEQIKKTTEEAQEIINKFFNAFPKVKKWIDSSIKDAHIQGFVEDVAGRRRRLPDVQLSKYDIKFVDPNRELNGSFNPFIGCTDRIDESTNKLLSSYKAKLEKIRYAKEYEKIQADALKDGIEIHSNTGFIAQAERQAVNCVDADTQILTLQGWKKYNEISIGDKILSFNTESQLIEEDSILDIYLYKENIDAIRIKHNGLNCISTLNHRWPLYSRGTKKVSFETTEYISKYKNYETKKIIKSADNAFNSTCELSDSELYLLGILFTDGHVYNIANKYEMSNRYACSIVQSSAKSHILDKIERHLDLASIKYSKRENTHKAEAALPSYTFNIHQPTATKWGKLFPDKRLTYDFINTLSQHQAKILLEGIIDGDGSYEKDSNGASIIVAKFDQVGVIQYLIIRAGYASTYRIMDYRGKKCYSDKITNKENYIEIKDIYYSIRVHSRRYADVLAKNCSAEVLDFAWCVRTNNSTWIARSADGYTFITGNSRVQGGAASLTKAAMIDIYHDDKLKSLGAYLINTVHDEILIEVPEAWAEEGAERLVELMVNAAKKYVTNVPMSCDPTIVTCWYLDVLSSTIMNEFKHLIEEGKSPAEAFELECAERSESTRSQIYEIVKGYLDYVPDGVDTTYKSL